jgi:hypothetical protein
MARMLGSGTYYGIPCTCCNGPRSVQVEKRREERAWRRELHPREQFPAPGDDPVDCRHGCNGDCITAGSDVCNWTCHPA